MLKVLDIHDAHRCKKGSPGLLDFQKWKRQRFTVTTIHQRQMAGTRWDPGQYLKFSDHRLRPALELLDRVPLQFANLIYDLGCGSGQVTRLIAERWPDAAVYGLDNSREMLAQAEAQAEAQPGRVRWVEADIATWSPGEPLDLIYSNATLHWVEAHDQLFPRLLGFLKPGGCL